ncbi:MAG TPA: hypothetical protein VFB34_04645 [Chloroflexota bacterium]|nr:hypothetical protein [Chloroflexota bacterium]
MIRRFSDRRPASNFDLGYALLVLVVALGSVLRFWMIGTDFHFMGDEGRESAAEWSLIHGKLPLLGPSLSIGHTLHLGPLFYYLEAIPMWLSNGSPVGPTILVGIFGVAATVMLFLYLKAPLGSLPAGGAALVMAASFLMVEYSRRPWNPTITPFFTLALLWALVSWKRGRTESILVVAASLACLVQLQPVNLFVIPVALVFILWARPPRPSAALLCGAVIIFVVISSPLLIYDGTHNLANLKAWLAVLIHGKSNAPSRGASSLKLLFNLFYRALSVPNVPLTVVLTVCLGAAGLAVSGLRSLSGEANWEVRLAMLLLVVAAVGFEIYRKQVFEQYMVCLFVIPFVLLGALLWLVGRYRAGKAVGVILVAALVVVGTRQTWTYSFVTPKSTVADAAITRNDLQPDDTYGHVLRVDRKIVSRSKGRPFELRMASYLNYPAGYHYVLSRLGHPPVSKAGTVFLIVEPGSWPRRKWPKATQKVVARADRFQTIGLIKLYEIPIRRQK